MLAISTTDVLSIVDAQTLKRAPTSVPATLSLTSPPTASTWSPDHAFLFLASSKRIDRFDPATNTLSLIHASSDIDHLVCKDTSTLIFSSANQILALDKTIGSHKSPITALSLSSDASLLASTSANAAHVHNLTLGSHTVLRGLTAQTIHTCMFHPHSRTRLLLGVGKQLVVFDTTRPSGPAKAVPMADATGNITAIACSPFSKSLIAVATTAGNVGLIDLDKEKGLFRTLNLKVPLTSLTFSAEGAAIYAGTEHGKLLIMDLRALDKPPRSIDISKSGARIVTMVVQKKTKSESNTRPATTTATKPATQPAQLSKPVPKVAATPTRARMTRTGSTASIKDRAASPSTKPKKTVEPETVKKTVFSPVRDPLGNSKSGTSDGDISVQLETLSAFRTTTTKPKTTPVKRSVSARSVPRVPSTSTASSSPPPPPLPRSRSTLAPPQLPDPTDVLNAQSARPLSSASSRHAKRLEDTEGRGARRPRTLPSTKPRTASASTASTFTTTSTTSGSASNLEVGPRRRERATSSASRISADPRPGSSASLQAGPSRGETPLPPLPPSRAGTNIDTDLDEEEERVGGSRTPSPEFPPIGTDVVTPIPVRVVKGKVGKEKEERRTEKKKGLGVLGLGTPEVERWVKAGNEEVGEKVRDKGKGKVVGFMDDEDEEAVGVGEDKEKEKERERAMAMQISPRRSTSWAPSSLHPFPMPSLDPAESLGHSNAYSNTSQSGGGAGGGSNPAHDLLKTIIQDALYEFQRETRAEIRGLHLDVVRMGRGWRREVGALREQFGDPGEGGKLLVEGVDRPEEELRRLREENRRLREENERLRRGL